MQNSHKKPYKGFYAKSKTQALEGHKHDSFESHPYEGHHYNKYGNTYKYSKAKKYYPEYTYQPVKDQALQPQGQHPGPHHPINVLEQNHQSLDVNDYPEKFIEISKNQAWVTEAPGHQEVSKPRGKGDKKPEKQLYSARRKYAKGAEHAKREANPLASTEASSQSQDSVTLEGKPDVNTSANENMEKKREITNEQKSNKSNQGSAKKERFSSEEEESFLSNVSTAMSDKMKPSENGKSNKDKGTVVEGKKKGKKAHRKLLVQIMLESENRMEKLRIFEDEEDYDAMLDQVCKSHNFKGIVRLYFKINMLQMIFNIHSDKSRVEPALSKNIALNTKLVLYEHGLQPIDDTIRALISANNGSF